MTPCYRYAARLVRVIDGDTYELDVDLGFKTHAHITARLRGLDTPERGTPEGVAARMAAESLLAGQPLVIESYKDQQTFARWVCHVYVAGQHVADLLREAGHVKGMTPGEPS